MGAVIAITLGGFADSQRAGQMDSVGSAMNGSMTAVSGSGIRTMSDSWISFHPVIDEESNMMPFLKSSSVTVPA